MSDQTETTASEPGAAPTTSQEPSTGVSSDESTNPAGTDDERRGLTGAALQEALKAARDAQAVERQRRKAIEAELEQLRKQAQEAEQAKLAQQGKWQELAETRASELEQLRSQMADAVKAEAEQRQAVVDQLRQSRLTAAVRAQVPGHLTSEQRERVARLALLDLDVEYDDQHQPKADFAAAVAREVEALGYSLEAPATKHRPIGTHLGRPSRDPASSDAEPLHKSPQMRELAATEAAFRRLTGR